MKITKNRLREIIKEELEVTLTNEEAGEIFGEAVEAQLEEQQLNEVEEVLSMLDPATLANVKLIAQTLGKIAVETGIPATIMAVGAMATEHMHQQKIKSGKEKLRARRAGERPEDEFPMAPPLPPMPK